MFLSLSENINANFSRQISPFINIVHFLVDEVNKRNTKRSSFKTFSKVPSNKCLEIFYFVKEKRRHYCKNRECRIFFETPTRMYKIYNVYNIWYTWYR